MDDGTKKRRPRRSFTDEFKAGAIRRVLEQGETAGQAADVLSLGSSQTVVVGKRRPVAELGLTWEHPSRRE
jgi:transposase-like protein